MIWETLILALRTSEIIDPLDVTGRLIHRFFSQWVKFLTVQGTCSPPGIGLRAIYACRSDRVTQIYKAWRCSLDREAQSHLGNHKIHYAVNLVSCCTLCRRN